MPTPPPVAQPAAQPDRFAADSPAPDDQPGGEGRVVLVIGGTSGIGLAAAQQVTREGGRVVVCSRDAERVARVADGLPGALGHAADVTDPASVERLVAACVATYGRLDAVVLTAQVMAYGTVEQVPHDVFRTVVDTAVDGTFHVARAVLPVFRAQGGGSLVVVSSLLAEITVPSMSAYCTAKWAQLATGPGPAARGAPRARPARLVRRPRRRRHPDLRAGRDVRRAGRRRAAAGGRRRSTSPRAAVRAIDRPRRFVHVGPVNRLAVLGFRLFPWVYDLMVGPLVTRLVLRGGAVAASPGNVLEPRPDLESVRGGWRWYGRRGARKPDPT